MTLQRGKVSGTVAGTFSCHVARFRSQRTDRMNRMYKMIYRAFILFILFILSIYRC